MFEVPCPKCRNLLAFEDQDVRRKTKCPLCHHKFTIPKPFPNPAAPVLPSFGCTVGCLTGILGLGSLMLWAIGWTWALIPYLCLWLLGINSAPIRCLLSVIYRDSRQRREFARGMADEASRPLLVHGIETSPDREPPLIPRPRMVTQQVSTSTMPTDDLIEIQAGTSSGKSPPAGTGNLPSRLEPREPESRAPRSVPNSLSRVEFLGPDTVVELDRGTLRGPLIYAIQSTLREPGDPSTIEFGLPVGRPGIVPGQEPPTWPTYRSFNASQRSFYLDWLIGGRRRNVPLPYVTLYVYGLERRVLVDAQDHDAVAQELIGLLQAYRMHYPFRRDVAALLWLTIDLSCQVQPVTRITVDAAIAQTQEWDEPLVRHCLAAFAALQWPIPAYLAWRITAEDPRSVNSVVVTRHAEMFRTLFEQRLKDNFPNGMILPAADGPEKIEYLIANPSLARLPRSETSLSARPRVSPDAAEITKLVEIWEQCVADLKVYDRVHRSAESGPLTAEMWEALPEISRQDIEHPESDAWHALLQQAFQKHGRPLVPISELAKIKQIEQRGRLTKKQSEQLVNTAGYLQLAVEPDARLTGKTYAWDEVVAVFPRRDATAEDLSAYQAASILLRLGMNIAAADGEINETELNRIVAHLEQQFEFSPTAADRLEHLRYALVHSPSSRGQIEKSLREKLHPDQRQVVGEFLVGIAVADGTISPAELKALKKAWLALGLEAKSLDALLKQPESTTTGANQPLVLDQDRISQIMLDTQRVAAMLKAAMSVEDEGLSESAQAPPVSQPIAVPEVASSVVDSRTAVDQPSSVCISNADWSGLALRYHDFLRHLISRPVWPRRDLDSYARSHQLMLGGALEAINEWTHELHGDWLTSEEADEIHVQQSLLGGEAK